MTVQYLDVSNWQPGLNLAGAAAVVAKASQGTGYTDPDYAGFKSQAAQLGIPFAAYHWLDTTDAAAQARHCFSVVGPDVPLMIDDEQNIIVVAHTLAFVDAYRQLGGLVTMEYAPHWVWQNSGQPDLTPLAQAGLALVSSNYTAYSDTGPGWAPYGGVTPAAWQWSSSYPFNGYSVDINAHHGSIEDLRAFFNGGSDMALAPDERAMLIELLQHMRATDNRVREAIIYGSASYTDSPGVSDSTHAPVEPWHVKAITGLAASLAQLQAAVTQLQAGGGTGAAPTHDQLVEAAFEGAQQAEKE